MRRIFVALLALGFLGAPANAQMIEKLNVENVGAVLSELGLAYGETTDNRGYPLLQINRVQPEGTFAARNINIFFYGCENGECNDITLYSWYETPSRVSAETFNEWNDIFRQARNWSRSYRDEEGDSVLIMNINAEGGIGEEALRILIFSYLREAQDFGHFLSAQAG